MQSRNRPPMPMRVVGFSLVEIALVLVLIGLLAAFFLPMGTKLREAKQIEETRAKLQSIEQALTRFVMLNDRLPCPADGALNDNHASAGVEQVAAGGGCAVANRGVVPWRTLGLAAGDALDAWNMRLTYRVYANTRASLVTTTANPSCAASPASPARRAFQRRDAFRPSGDPNENESWSGFLRNCPNPAPRVGFRVDGNVSNGSCGSLVAQPGVPHGTGAAYVLISHGPNKCGGYTPSGVYVGSCVGAAMGAAEQNNRNNQAPHYNASACYKDGGPLDNRFDDIVLWRTVMQVAADAKKVN